MRVVIVLERPSAAEAEEAIARVWLALEARDIVTPRLTVTERSNTNIELLFASPRDGELVLEDLRKGAWPVLAQRVN